MEVYTTGLALEDIQAFGLMYVQRLENRMRNIDSLKELEKQHNIRYVPVASFTYSYCIVHCEVTSQYRI